MCSRDKNKVLVTKVQYYRANNFWAYQCWYEAQDGSQVTGSQFSLFNHLVSKAEPAEACLAVVRDITMHRADDNLALCCFPEFVAKRPSTPL